VKARRFSLIRNYWHGSVRNLDGYFINRWLTIFSAGKILMMVILDMSRLVEMKN
jgi:hypothetical protein